MANNWFPVINRDNCIECGKCIDKCTHGVYDKSNSMKPAIIYTEGCIDKCHGCGDLCPTGSITYVGDNTGWVPPNLQTSDKSALGTK